MIIHEVLAQKDAQIEHLTLKLQHAENRIKELQANVEELVAYVAATREPPHPPVFS